MTYICTFDTIPPMRSDRPDRQNGRKANGNGDKSADKSALRIELPSELHRALKKHSVDSGKTMKAVVVEALNDVLATGLSDHRRRNIST